MAETPFPPGPGAADAAPAPDPGSQGMAEAAPAVPEPEPAPQEALLSAEEPVAQPPAADEQPATPAAQEFAPPPEPATTVAEPSEPVPVEPPGAAPEPAVAAEPAAEPTPAWSASVSAEPVPEAVPAAEPPGVAATIEVPPLEGGSAQEGGEWELLLNRVTGWWNSGELGRQWQRIRGPLKGVAILVAVLLALRAYATVVSTIDAIPLVSGLLELAGLITVLQFAATRLVRSSDRQEVLAAWRQRWLDFRGRD